MKSRYKSPWSALLWSFVLPGFGPFYNGQLVMYSGLNLMAFFNEKSNF
ncbi:hypothetical protein [Bacillus seohaeanensis]|uniref:DUF5683 domain-containing protein n=1 Tax=Bacillus seohaeanensis TaxID=284580 RepID=A0ABW5RTZ4_9BACI